MKRLILTGLFALLSCPAIPAADDPAAKQETDERLTRLNADVESLVSANASMQKRLSAMADEIKALRDEQARQANTSSVQEDLKRLAEKIVEVDRKRQSDKDLIVEKIEKLGAAMTQPAVKPSVGKMREPSDSHPDRTDRRERASVSEKGFEYVVQKGDNLSSIVNEYNAEFKKKGMKTISSKLVLDANPNLKPEKMHVGQKIFIPMPPS